MYSGITQAQMAKALFMSESQYNRKENGQSKLSLREAKKIASLLELNERVTEKFWMADTIYDLMKIDKDLVYDAIEIVEMHYDDYETCVEIPNKNNSYSSLAERMRHRRKK